MRKTILSGFFISIFIFVLLYNIYEAKVQRDNSLSINSSIKNIELINKDFDIYIKNTLAYDNFDIIQKKIKILKKNLEKIEKNNIFSKQKSTKVKNSLNILRKKLNNKLEILDRVKSYKSILNNSYRIIQKIKLKEISNDFNKIYTTILIIDKSDEINLESEFKNVNKMILNHKYNNKYEKFFLVHSKNILNYQIKLRKTTKELYDLNIENNILIFNNNYKEYINSVIYKAELSIIILLILLIIMIIFYFIYEYKLRVSNQELLKFKNAVEYSDNIVVITDGNENIKYVNESFVKSTGYTKEEAVGKKPNILKSKELSKEFYKNLKQTIYGGKIWRGEFINRNKFDEIRYEKASITPILGENGDIQEFIAMKLDVTKDRINELKLIENERMLIQQSKMASMGEMIGNIAHQWRQPLSIISTIATGIQMQIELNMPVEQKQQIENLEKIEETIQFLSQTIDDFRDFFKPDKEKVDFNIKDIYLKTLKLLSSKLDSLDIKLIENLEDIQIHNLENELMQVVINILNNARDILETKEEQDKLIFVNIYKNEEFAIIDIIDNAGGIPEDIIDKIFEPYFTTKHKSNGTGIGLYMSHEMIFKHMNGFLLVENIEYDYNSNNYKGAKFSVKVPLEIN